MLHETFDMTCIVPTTSWVKSYGTEYQPGMYVCSGVENEMPLFNRIVSVIVKEDNAYLLTCKVSTTYFDDHLNAFSIEEKSDVFTLICVDDLPYYRPYDFQMTLMTKCLLSHTVILCHSMLNCCRFMNVIVVYLPCNTNYFVKFVVLYFL